MILVSTSRGVHIQRASLLVSLDFGIRLVVRARLGRRDIRIKDVFVALWLHIQKSFDAGVVLDFGKGRTTSIFFLTFIAALLFAVRIRRILE